VKRHACKYKMLTGFMYRYKVLIGFIRPEINPLTPHLEKALKI
jgi:hypothetical protein